MSGDIQTFIDHHPVYDVHEHHMPGGIDRRDVGLIDILWESYAGWTRGLPFPLRSDNTFTAPARESEDWAEVARFVEESGSNAFVRNIVASLAELYDLDGGAITRENWQALDAEVRRRHRNADWTGTVLDRAGITRIITDPFENPLMDARKALGDRYRSVLRINALAFGWHPDSRDHNDNSAHDFAADLGFPVDTFDHYLDMLPRLLDGMAERGQVSLKIALAYDRSVDFDDVDEGLARRAWGNPDPSAEERKAFGDVVVDRLCALAGERDLPVQMHLGTARIRGSHPMKAAGLIERHPGTRFALMHLAFPWSRDLLGMAFIYRNVWLDLTWSAMLSPSYFKQTLYEAIEVLPDDSRMMIGGDNWHAEETYGAIQTLRRLIGEVLAEKVGDGYFPVVQACGLAGKILHDNAMGFFG